MGLWGNRRGLICSPPASGVPGVQNLALSGPAAKATTGRHAQARGPLSALAAAEEDFDDIWVEKGTKDGSTVQ